jgi:hypothetical protein
MEGDERHTLEGACDYIIEALDCEEFRIKVARALEYKRIVNEQQCLGRGLIWGGIISVSIWVVLGVILLKNF